MSTEILELQHHLGNPEINVKQLDKDILHMDIS
jgi:hypothetical protein